MKERDKRFELIRIAVSLADHEVIDLQIKRLRNFSTDPRLHEILRELEHKNFRQALFLMQEYVAAPEDDFFAASSQDDAPVQTTTEPESPATGLFDLDTRAEEEERILGLDDMLKMTRESAVSPREYVSPDTTAPSPVEEATHETVAQEPAEEDPLFSLDRAREMPESESEETPFSEAGAARTRSSETDTVASESSPAVNQAIEQELFAFDHEEKAMPEVPETDRPFPSGETPPAMDDGTVEYMDEDMPQTTSAETEPEDKHEDGVQTAAEEAAAPDAPVNDIFSVPSDAREGEPSYAAFAYMGQKYRNMLHQYPQVEVAEDGISPEVQRFIDMVSTQDYTESQVEAAIARYQQLRDQGKRAEAAQMLIAAATTESTFAQFMLARELFKGDVLKQDHPEAFTQINHLAEQDYPEAICDLGQLYEYGIGIDKNKQHALLLYEEAAEMGIERARRHYERLRAENPLKRLSGLFRRKK